MALWCLVLFITIYNMYFYNLVFILSFSNVVMCFVLFELFLAFVYFYFIFSNFSISTETYVISVN